jgi:hypothetical protein
MLPLILLLAPNYQQFGFNFSFRVNWNLPGCKSEITGGKKMLSFCKNSLGKVRPLNDSAQVASLTGPESSQGR